MVDKSPSGKKRTRSPSRRQSPTQRRKPSTPTPSQSEARGKSARPVRSGRRPQNSDKPKIRLANAAVVAAMAGTMIFLLQGPLSANASPPVIQGMSGVMVLWGLFTFWTTRFARPAKAAAVYLVIIACTGLQMKFRLRDFLDTSIDLVIVSQGLIYVGFLALVLIGLSRKMLRFKKHVIIAFGSIAVLGLLSIINAPDSGYSTASTIALLATMAFAAHYAITVPPTDMAATLALATAPLVLLSFVVLMFPGHVGDFLWVHEPSPTARLTGVANSPIGMALFSAQLVIGLVAKSLFNDRREPVWIVAAIILIPIALVCMWSSGSRGPSAGMAIALVLGSLLALRPFGRTTVPIFFAAFLLMLPLIYFTVTETMNSESLSVISRSGQAEEVATLTGRTSVWTYTLGQISNHPILGHGLGSPLQLFADIPRDLVGEIVEAHNLLLHASLMIGVPGALVLAWLILYSTRQAYGRRSAFALIVLLFFVVTGITENFAFPNRPGWQTLIFFATVLVVCRQRQGRSPRQPGPNRPSLGTKAATEEIPSSTPASPSKA